MTDLLAIDPSIVSPGASLFRDGVLIACARIKLAVNTELNAAERCCVAAEGIISWTLQNNGAVCVDEIAHEWPQIYVRERSKGDPNDLPFMAGVDLAVVSAFSVMATMQRRSTPRVFCYKPAEWVGQLPKATKGSAKSSPRGKRVISRLSPVELLLLPDQHDAIDSCGIGLHRLGRLGVRRVLASS